MKPARRRLNALRRFAFTSMASPGIDANDVLQTVGRNGI
jgi:hypothetical protein